ncbi:MFS transporter [Streptomyces sp. SL13]|uniref:MFS transporter n=1 Tax=Streptantibioticus silvisoli TaxID=2705255 RepID=A0AA90H2S3_9ACTN|nr:MFS transporter [Streptantibioticus silvisoli]MDI5969167.1 MFS transporter [Streptantibioticus silvisoli]
MTVVDPTTGSYRRLLARPDLRRLAITDVCARLPQGMVSITLLLVASHHASLSAAGAVVGGYSLGQALTAPLRGRLADRHGLRAVVPLCLAGYLTALLGLALAVDRTAPAAVLTATAVLAGLLTPPLSPALRGLWARGTPPGLRRTAFALDAVIFDLTAIAGPALAGALATTAGPYAALGVLLALTATAAAVVAARSAPPPAPTAPRPPGRSAAQRFPAPRRLLVTAALTNLALTATEVSLTACVRQAGALWAAGPLLAALSAGSIAGSLALGGRAAGARRAGLPLLLTGYAAGLALLAAAALDPPLLAVAAPVAGLFLGSTLAALFSAAADAAPRGAAIEAQSWVNTIMSGGASAGAALAGGLAPHPPLGLALAAGCVALGALTVRGLDRSSS